MTRRTIGRHRTVLQEYIRKEEFRRVCGGGWDEYIRVSSPRPLPLTSLYQSTCLALAINEEDLKPEKAKHCFPAASYTCVPYPYLGHRFTLLIRRSRKGICVSPKQTFDT